MMTKLTKDEKLAALVGKRGTHVTFCTRDRDCEIALRGFMSRNGRRGVYRIDRHDESGNLFIVGTPRLVDMASAYVAGWIRCQIGLTSLEREEWS